MQAHHASDIGLCDPIFLRVGTNVDSSCLHLIHLTLLLLSEVMTAFQLQGTLLYLIVQFYFRVFLALIKCQVDYNRHGEQMMKQEQYDN